MVTIMIQIKRTSARIVSVFGQMLPALPVGYVGNVSAFMNAVNKSEVAGGGKGFTAKDASKWLYRKISDYIKNEKPHLAEGKTNAPKVNKIIPVSMLQNKLVLGLYRAKGAQSVPYWFFVVMANDQYEFLDQGTAEILKKARLPPNRITQPLIDEIKKVVPSVQKSVTFLTTELFDNLEDQSEFWSKLHREVVAHRGAVPVVAEAVVPEPKIESTKSEELEIVSVGKVRAPKEVEKEKEKALAAEAMEAVEPEVESVETEIRAPTAKVEKVEKKTGIQVFEVDSGSKSAGNKKSVELWKLFVSRGQPEPHKIIWTPYWKQMVEFFTARAFLVNSSSENVYLKFLNFILTNKWGKANLKNLPVQWGTILLDKSTDQVEIKEINKEGESIIYKDISILNFLKKKEESYLNEVLKREVWSTDTDIVSAIINGAEEGNLYLPGRVKYLLDDLWIDSKYLGFKIGVHSFNQMREKEGLAWIAGKREIIPKFAEYWYALLQKCQQGVFGKYLQSICGLNIHQIEKEISKYVDIKPKKPKVKSEPIKIPVTEPIESEVVEPEVIEPIETPVVKRRRKGVKDLLSESLLGILGKIIPTSAGSAINVTIKNITIEEPKITVGGVEKEYEVAIKSEKAPKKAEVKMDVKETKTETIPKPPPVKIPSKGEHRYKGETDVPLVEPSLESRIEMQKSIVEELETGYSHPPSVKSKAVEPPREAPGRGKVGLSLAEKLGVKPPGPPEVHRRKKPQKEPQILATKIEPQIPEQKSPEFPGKKLRRQPSGGLKEDQLIVGERYVSFVDPLSDVHELIYFDRAGLQAYQRGVGGKKGRGVRRVLALLNFLRQLKGRKAMPAKGAKLDIVVRAIMDEFGEEYSGGR
jgi:hypothetical protein